jgi:16S rRNA (cytosine967-C5)-methyltransferase
MIAPARLAAYGILRAVVDGRRDLPAALALERDALADERDRALAGEIAVGTLRWQAKLDHLIATYTKRRIEKLDPEIVAVLRLTIFQLLHLDRVPASAAVNDAVNLARKSGKTSAAPLVNAVLRRISRERDRLPLPPRVTDDREQALDYLAITLSHPRWLTARWLDRHGFESAEAWCTFDNEPAALTLRANSLKVTRDQLADHLRAAGVDTRLARHARHALVVERGNPLLASEVGHDEFMIQDEASQLVATLVGAVAGERILDVCAAPGGKTLAIAAAMGDVGTIVAADVRARRVRLLRDAVRVAGAASVRIVQSTAAGPLPFAAVFDRVLIDAPCSGLGTLRRDPDIKWRRDERELATLAAAQLAMLTHASAVVRPGGCLIYSTCSSEPEENVMVVERFLRGHSAFRREPLSFGQAPELINPDGDFQTLPFRDGLEGFYAARLVNAGSLG